MNVVSHPVFQIIMKDSFLDRFYYSWCLSDNAAAGFNNHAAPYDLYLIGLCGSLISKLFK